MNNLENILENLDTLANQDTVVVETYNTMIGMDIRRELNELRLNTYSAKILNNYICKLEEENKRLKEIVENLTTLNVCGDKKQIENTAQYKLELSQQRINKAIEYIQSTKYEWGDLEEDNEDYDIDVYKLLKLLKGEENGR